MEDAVERVLAAKDEGEKVMVFGDRDVDGISGAALLTRFLDSQGIDVTARIPVGDEPYGLSLKAVEEFAADYGTLIITADCGISCFEEVERANELGVDVIITDHHNPQKEIPKAPVIVNPKLNDPPYPFASLSGCGVAYKLVSALRFALKSEIYGQELCLLNTRPLNEAWVIEVAKLRNLVVIDSLTETVVPGMVSISQTRLPAFLQGQQILVWDAALQKRALGTIFGSGVEINMLDIAGEVAKVIPSVAGKTLVRIKELSRMAKYEDEDIDELDMFVHLFSAFAYHQSKLFDDEHAQDLQLVSLATLSDIMPLLGENRIIVRQGLKSLREKPRPGLSDLLFKLDLSGRRIGASDVSWNVTPVVNSAGRMGNPRKALDLLIEKDAAKRDTLANNLMEMNSERKKLGEETWLLVQPLAAANMALFANKLAVAYNDTIMRGVAGIMASRLSAHFKVPSLVASINNDVITASLRSYRGYNLQQLLEPLGDLCIDWGGHNFAAGFSILKENWQAFWERLQSAAAEIELEALDDEEALSIDAELPLSYLTPNILTVVDRFEPYGEQNAPLTFLAKNLHIIDATLMGKPEAKHVKLTLDTGKYKWAALYWQAAEKLQRDFNMGDHVDAVFKISRNWFKGNETPQLIISDLKRSGT